MMTAVLAFTCFTGCSTGNTDGKEARYSAEFLDLFDTVTQIVCYCESEEEFSEYKKLVYDTLKQYHELYDIYHEYEGINNIKTINDNAGIKPVKADEKIISLLLFSKEAYEASGGKVNIAFGPVLEIWHDYRERGIANPSAAELPPAEALEKAAVHTEMDKVVIDEEESTVFLEQAEMSLDVGAIAKGYAAEAVCGMLKEKGYTNGLISVGGNVRVLGGKGAGNLLWNVGIQNPDPEAEEAALYTLGLKDMSLVTSGDYQRYYTVGGKRYHHIINPDTLMPADYFTAVTIVCGDSGMADALSTAAFNMPYEEGKTLVESIQGAEAVWIFADGSRKFTDGFKALLNE